MYDNRPAEHAYEDNYNGEVVNDVGIAECQTHTERMASTVNWDLKQDEGGSAGGVVAALLICAFLAGGTYAYCRYKKK